jgi:hypothetical protein
MRWVFAVICSNISDHVVLSSILIPTGVGGGSASTAPANHAPVVGLGLM